MDLLRDPDEAFPIGCNNGVDCLMNRLHGNLSLATNIERARQQESIYLPFPITEEAGRLPLRRASFDHEEVIAHGEQVQGGGRPTARHLGVGDSTLTDGDGP